MMYYTCPFCDADLLGVVEQTWERVPLYEDGFDPSEGSIAATEVVSVFCPRCKWAGDALYYEAGALSGQVTLHFHIGAVAGTAGEAYEEYTACYVPPRSEDDSLAWLLTDWSGEREVGRFPTLVKTVCEALRLLREELGENAMPTYGAGCPSDIILQLALGEESKDASKEKKICSE
jgi:hypothetical protein